MLPERIKRYEANFCFCAYWIAFVRLRRPANACPDDRSHYISNYSAYDCTHNDPHDCADHSADNRSHHRAD